MSKGSFWAYPKNLLWTVFLSVYAAIFESIDAVFMKKKNLGAIIRANKNTFMGLKST